MAKRTVQFFLFYRDLFGLEVQPDEVASKGGRADFMHDETRSTQVFNHTAEDLVRDVRISSKDGNVIDIRGARCVRRVLDDNASVPI